MVVNMTDVRADHLFFGRLLWPQVRSSATLNFADMTTSIPEEDAATIETA
jgi:hypothetical protein